MKESAAARQAMIAFYERFSSADTEGFADIIAESEGVSVIGSGPNEGHASREEWIAAYDEGIKELGIKLEGDNPRAYEDGSTGWGVDRPSFVMPGGRRLPTRLTAVLHRDDGEWKVVHLHFSVGVPDAQAVEFAQSAAG